MQGHEQRQIGARESGQQRAVAIRHTVENVDEDIVLLLQQQKAEHGADLFLKGRIFAILLLVLGHHQSAEGASQTDQSSLIFLIEKVNEVTLETLHVIDVEQVVDDEDVEDLQRQFLLRLAA